MRKYKILVAIVISFFPFNIINAQSICISTYHSNVLYDQIPNHVSVNIGSLSCKLLSLESEDLIISHLGECDYILNTKRKGKVSLTVKIKRTHNRIPIIKKLIFEVQEFPEPKVYIEGFKNGDSISVDELRNINKISSKIGLGVVLEQKIEGFKILHQKTKKNQEIFEFTGQFLDSHFFEYLKKNSEKGDLLIIYDVILNVEHTKVLCNPIQLSIR